MVERAIEGPLNGGIVAKEGAEAVVGLGGEPGGEAAARVLAAQGGKLVFAAGGFGFEVEAVGLELTDSECAPPGRGELVDEHALLRGCRLVLRVEASADFVVGDVVFVAKDDGAGGEAVFERVAAGGGFSFRGSRAGGSLSVRLVGGGLGGGGHDGFPFGPAGGSASSGGYTMAVRISFAYGAKLL